MSTDAAHQRLLLQLQTSRQWEKKKINQGRTKGYHSEDSRQSSHVAIIPLQDRDRHCGLVRASLSPEGLRSLVPAPPKDLTPWPFSSS